MIMFSLWAEWGLVEYLLQTFGIKNSSISLDLIVTLHFFVCGSANK